MPAKILAQDTAHHKITQAQSRQEGVWVFTDGSVQDDFSGAAAIFVDAHGPLGGTSLQFPLSSFQSSIDAELTGIRGALSYLSQPRDWHRATIMTDSQVAIQIIQVTDWRQCRTFVLSIQ